jgi:hypothetical protein
LDLEEPTLQEIPIKAAVTEYTEPRVSSLREPIVNCLRNEKVIVRHINRATNLIRDPRHVLFGGMAENASRTYTVPKLSSGAFANVLTNSEKAFLEEIMQLEYNALSVHRKTDNFWDDSNDKGITRVRLLKQDTILDLSIPEDYIKYKILLKNKDYIAPSLQALQDTPKASYEYVLITEGEETKVAQKNMSATMMCYKEFGKVEDDIDTLRVIVESIDGRPTAPNVSLAFLQTKANELIQGDSKLFLRIITDPLLQTKVLIKKAIEANLISKRGTFLYLRSDNTPLCEANEEPTLNVAAKYLNLPKHQDIKFALEAKLK